MKKLCYPLLPKTIYTIVDSDETIVIEKYIEGKSIQKEAISKSYFETASSFSLPIF